MPVSFSQKDALKNRREARGFTLLELLIVITILAILAVVVIIVINPAETLRRGRDSQRLSDLSSIKSAIGLYMTDVTGPHLANGTDANCLADSAGDNTTGKIFYSLNSDTTDGEDITDDTPPATVGSQAGAGGADWDALNAWVIQVATLAEEGEVDGTGWLPVDLADISSGSPLSAFPSDPTNDVSIGGSTAAAVTNDGLLYRYACDMSSPEEFEINAVMESSLFANDGDDDKESSDGGDNAQYYEVGTSLRLLPTGTDF